MSKRRALVLYDESARHPFLVSLAPHVRRRTLEKAKTAGAGWRDFLTAYCASFVAVAVFIA